METSNSPRYRTTLIFLALLAVAYVGIQVFIAYQYSRLSTETQESILKQKTLSVDDRKKLEEIIALRIENSRKQLFWATFVSNVGATIGIVVALVSIWMGFRQFMQATEKQQQERMKAHRERIAIDLNELWRSVITTDSTQRAGAVAGLQDLLTQDKAEFHRRAASALALIGRMKDDSDVLQTTLGPVIEYSMRRLKTEDLTSISWQKLKLLKPNFSGTQLSGIDFRDTALEEADFTGADLRGARFNASRLNGAKFDKAQLDGANLEYADIAGASFRNASLRNANFCKTKLLDADFKGADLTGTESAFKEIDITLSKGWREAVVDEGFKAQLIREHGSGRRGPRVLMLMWEMEPVVSGGGWTAAFHLVKNLCRQGADITIMVPWVDASISRSVFGNEVDLVPVGVNLVTGEPLGYANGSDQETDGGPSSNYDAYSADSYSAYAYAYGRSQWDLVNQFTKKAIEYIKDHVSNFDIVHAHDWLTFNAARYIAENEHIPWVAHFHSIEADRRKKPVRCIQDVEENACHAAERIVTPSKKTRQRVSETYGIGKENITPVYNCLSGHRLEKGRITPLEPGLVLFAGRFSWQKGPDRFIRIARQIQELRPKTEFAMYGRKDKGSTFEATTYSESLYDFMRGNQGINIEELIEESKVVRSKWSMEAIGKDEIERIRADIKGIEPVKIEENRLVRQGELKDNDREMAIEQLLAHGSVLLPHNSVPLVEPRNGKDMLDYDWLAIVDNENGEKANSWGYLIKVSSIARSTSLSRVAVNIDINPFIPWKRRHDAFKEAAALVVPSRHEPFGMIVLEAMQSGVPVFVTSEAGVCEVIDSPIQINAADTLGTAVEVVSHLRDQHKWHEQVERQNKEIATYHECGYEQEISKIWQNLVPEASTR